MARRFAEAGVRFVQHTHSYRWDRHDNRKADHRKDARDVDRPIAGLLTDLNRPRMLKDTLVLWGGEFGRTRVAEGKDVRDYNPHGFTMFLAGGRGEVRCQPRRDRDYGYYSVTDKVHAHDLHATVPHSLGVDHMKLTCRHAGRHFRLADVHGGVVKAIPN
jgi:hypothetical protein